MRSAIAFAAVAALSLTAFAQDQAAQPLKVRKIVVYKHGVGYFEREGKVTGNQQVALTFKTAQMKDLLKSLFAVDLNGLGRISVKLDLAALPVQERLAGFRAGDQRRGY